MSSDPTCVDTLALIERAYQDMAAINTKLWDAAEMVREVRATLGELGRRAALAQTKETGHG